MAQNISARRGATIAGFAALILLVLLAAFDNQWLEKWRAGRSAGGGDAAHSWTAGPVAGIGALAWRATKDAGESSRVYLGTLAEPVIAVILTFLLLMLVCRGVGAERGRWSLLLGTWFVTGLAASAALIAGSGIANTAVASGMADSSGPTQFGRGEVYYALIAMGLAFGLFTGWLVGFVAVLVYGSTEVAAGAADDEDERSTREYEPPSYADYASPDYSASDYSSSSSSPSSEYASSSPDYSSPNYSFSPTSPYSANAASSANAPTEIKPPSRESYPPER